MVTELNKSMRSFAGRRGPGELPHALFYFFQQLLVYATNFRDPCLQNWGLGGAYNILAVADHRYVCIEGIPYLSDSAVQSIYHRWAAKFSAVTDFFLPTNLVNDVLAVARLRLQHSVCESRQPLVLFQPLLKLYLRPNVQSQRRRKVAVATVDIVYCGTNYRKISARRNKTLHVLYGHLSVCLNDHVTLTPPPWLGWVGK